MSDTPRTAERFDEILRGYGEWGPGAQAAARWWAESLEREVTRLRKIAAHVPGLVYIKAKEAAGYSVTVRALADDPQSTRWHDDTSGGSGSAGGAL